MNTNSLISIFKTVLNTIRRFPMALVCAFCIACIAIYFTTFTSDPFKEIALRNCLMSLYVGMISYISLTIFIERYSIRFASALLLNLLVLVLIICYYFSFNIVLVVSELIMYAVLVLAAHLSVSFAPYIVNREINGFWQYNRIVFLRFLTAVLYSTVLFVGLSLALMAIDNLFEIKIDYSVYQQLWIVISLLFNTLFFLSGIPVNVSGLNIVKDYPIPLKLFTQFVLLPLVTIYLLILYVYESKIILTGIWPVGWVSYLVIGFSIAGILALLLIWPWRDDTRYSWINKYSKGFFIAIFPLIVLLSLAIYKRVSEYGITEKRYFLILLSIWLVWNSVYFIFSRIKNIKMIPLSLFISCIISIFGPQSAFSISRISQLHRLELFLKINNDVKFDKMKSNQHKFDIENAREIVSIIDYLIDTHGTNSIQPLFQQNLDSIFKIQDSTVYINKTKMVADLLKIDYDLVVGNTNYKVESGLEGANYSSSSDEPLEISGYDFFVDFNFYIDERNNKTTDKLVNGHKLKYTYTSNSWDIFLHLDSVGDANINLHEFFFELKKFKYSQYNIPTAKMRIPFTSTNIDGVLIVKSVNSNIDWVKNKLQLQFINGYLLLKDKSKLKSHE